MPSALYILLIITSVIIGIVVLFVIFFAKKNSHTELYSEGLHNENDGHYDLALHNYENALREITKLRLDKKFHDKIAQKIKILQTTIDYEKNFRLTTNQNNEQETAGPNNKQVFEAVH